MTKDFIFYLHT